MQIFSLLLGKICSTLTAMQIFVYVLPLAVGMVFPVGVSYQHVMGFSLSLCKLRYGNCKAEVLQGLWTATFSLVW